MLEQRAMDLEELQQEVQESFQEAMQQNADESARMSSGPSNSEQRGVESELEEQNPGDMTESTSTPADVASTKEPSNTPSGRQNSGEMNSMERRQAEITRRLGDQQDQASAVRDWISSNGLRDEQIEMVISQVEEALADGVEASVEAMQSMTRSTDSGQPDSGTGLDQETAREVLESQQEVRDALQDVVEALSEDQESWLITRRLDGIESQQQSLREQTQAMADETRGQSVSELSQETRGEMENMARAQEALQDQVAELMQEMQELAEAMEDVDPSAAQAMQNAVEAAEETEIQESMAEASEQIEEGRLENAGGSQEQAMQALQAMKGAMSPTEQEKIADLLRRLADMEEAVQQLVFLQSNELQQLIEAIESGLYQDRDTTMISIRNRTLSVTDDARGGSDEERGIARRLNRASDSQGEAISSLRRIPVEGESA
ncbi:MAG: hypothetical protein MK089_13310, partial [Phycisphaerales bacterium]|nr:hypothetical protein [Phycisphaerales bacterium]